MCDYDYTESDIMGARDKPNKSQLEDTALLVTKVHELTDRDICVVCLENIEMMVFRGTGVCCELHEKVRDGKLTLADVTAIQIGLTHEDGIK